MSIMEQPTATPQQLQDAGLDLEAALVIASAIAAAQKENSERMTAMENAIREMTAAIKVLGERQAEINWRLGTLEERMAEYQVAIDKRISDLLWKMAFLMAFMQAPVYGALLGRAMGWWQ